MAAEKIMKGEKRENRMVMKRIMQYIKPYSLFLIISFLCAAVSVAAQLLVPIFCGNAIDAMIGKGQVDFNGVGTIVVAIAAATVITAAAQ